MKKIVFALLPFGCMFVQSSCTLDLSFDSEVYESKISINADGNNSDGSISKGGYLATRIIGEDYDGISQIRLQIPALKIDQVYTNYSHNNDERWEINQTFNIDDIDFDARREIRVTLIDNHGSEYSRAISLKVNE
jgi:hypothetical protein